MTDSLDVTPLPRGLVEYKRGGVSVLYRHPTDERLLIKVFTDSNHRPRPQTGEQARRIVSLASFQQGLTFAQAERLNRTFSWPVGLYGRDEHSIDAVAIPLAPDDFWIDLETRNFATQGVDKVRMFQDFSFLLTDYLKSRKVIHAPYRTISQADRVEICRELLLTMQTVWSLGYRYCDYKPYNMAWTLAGRPRVFVIDAETVEQPGRRGMHSPGEWWPPDPLIDTMESDRVLCTRMMWRVLVGDMGSVPRHGAIPARAHGLRKATVAAFVEAHETGTSDAVESVLSEIDEYRSEENVAASFAEACATPWAEVVLQYQPRRPDSVQADYLARAANQLNREREMLALPSHIRTVRLSRSVPEPGFAWNIPEHAPEEPGTIEMELLRSLALEGDHGEVAEIALGSKLVGASRMVERCMQVVLGEVPAPSPTETTGRDAAPAIGWSWPGAGVVRGARVTIVTDKGKTLHDDFVVRIEPRPTFALTNQRFHGALLTCTVAYASKLANGRWVTATRCGHVTIRATRRQSPTTRDRPTVPAGPSRPPLITARPPGPAAIHPTSTSKKQPQRSIARRWWDGVRRVFGRRH